MLTRARIAALAKLHKAASLAPWVEDDGNIFSKPQQEIEWPLRRGSGGRDTGVWDGLVAKCAQDLPNFDADAEFITAMRNALPALLEAALRDADVRELDEWADSEDEVRWWNCGSDQVQLYRHDDDGAPDTFEGDPASARRVAAEAVRGKL